jgi:uncharacterized SAM-binding protein YcdF (DUF218 family)
VLLGLGGFLWKSGEILVRGDSGTEPVRWAAVLAGEGREMERSEAAWALFQEGRFDSLILSGPRTFKTRHESEFSAAFLETRSFPKDRVFQLPHEATSTAAEATVLIRQARLLGIDTLLLLTSDFHSARAGRIFRKLSADYPVIRIHAAVTPGFDPRAWWSSRQSKEIWLLEWIKTVYTAWEMLRWKPLEGATEFVQLEPNPRPLSLVDSLAALRPDPAIVKDSVAAPVDTAAARPKPDSAAKASDSAKAKAPEKPALPDSGAPADTIKKKAKDPR